MVNTVLIQTPENGEQCVKTNNGNEEHDNNSFMSVEVPNKLHYIQLTLIQTKISLIQFLRYKTTTNQEQESNNVSTFLVPNFFLHARQMQKDLHPFGTA